MDNSTDALQSHLSSMSDEDLLRMITDRSQMYRDEVIKMAQKTAESRGLVSNFSDIEFKVITAEGRENGPLDVSSIKNLYLKGLVNQESLVYVASSNQWVRLQDVFDTFHWETKNDETKEAETKSEPFTLPEINTFTGESEKSENTSSEPLRKEIENTEISSQINTTKDESSKCRYCERLLDTRFETEACRGCLQMTSAERDRQTRIRSGDIKLEDTKMSETQIPPTSLEDEPQNNKQGKKGRFITTIIISVIIAVAAGVVGKTCGKMLFHASSSSQSSYAESEARWQRYSLPETQLSLELPSEPQQDTVQLPQQVRSRVVSYKGYKVEREDLMVGITYVESVSGIIINTEAGARGAVENLRGLEGVSNLQYSLNNRSATETSVNGSLTRDGIVKDISGFVRGNGQRMWSVFSLSNLWC